MSSPPSNRIQPRWRVSESIAARLSQIRRDHGDTWDCLFARMIRSLEDHTAPLPASRPETEIRLLGKKTEELLRLNRQLAERIEEQVETITAIEPMMEQTNQLVSQLVKLLQLALRVEAADEETKPTGRRPTKLGQYLKERG